MSEFIKDKEYYDINGRLCRLVEVLQSGFLVQYGVVFEDQEEDRIEAQIDSYDDYHRFAYTEIAWEELLHIVDQIYLVPPKHIHDKAIDDARAELEGVKKDISNAQKKWEKIELNIRLEAPRVKKAQDAQQLRESKISELDARLKSIYREITSKTGELRALQSDISCQAALNEANRTLTVSPSDIESLFNEKVESITSTSGITLYLVEQGEWIDDGKYQNASLILRGSNGFNYQTWVTRSGSYSSDYFYQFNDTLTAVKKAEVRKEEWVTA